MESEEQDIPDRPPDHWSIASDLWRDVEAELPPGTPEDLRRQLEADCYGLFERAFDHRHIETEVSVTGDWGPEFVAAFVKRAVEVGTRQVFNIMLGELLQLRVEVATLKAKVRNLERDSR
jgi:hypothetical protein